MEILYNKILDIISADNGCIVTTVISSSGSSPRKVGAKMIVSKDGSICGTIGGGALEKTIIKDALDALKRKRTCLKTYSLNRGDGLQVCGGKVDIFFEIVEAQKKLVIMGAGHIGLALSFIGKLLGYNVVIIDNRSDFANRKRFPHVDKIVCSSYSKAFKDINVDFRTAIVIVTHGHLNDEECLQRALKTGAGYVGMIGSRSKIKLLFNNLLKKGFKKTDLQKVHSPIGLDIGAETPEEIAVAIAAELVQENNK
ncbi:MAG TPA: XdhC/CoxI family protein [Candidatus Omnitrophota bacterium]|nr:XdhC/CoxI family protein [Candidatus Omnitrophota bacterium]